MNRAAWRLRDSPARALALLVLLLCGCATESHGDGKGSPPADSAVRAADAADAPPISLTLFPVWGTARDASGNLVDEPLEGAIVCMVRRRAWGQGWDDFVETDGPCSEPSVAGQNVVIRGLPENSEVILSATREGYQSRAFAVTTGMVDQDATTSGTDLHQMAMGALEEAARAFPGTDPAAGGWLSIHALNGSVAIAWAAGVGAALDPPRGAGPFAIQGGVAVPGLKTTPGGTFGSLDVPGLCFTDLPENEYVVRVEWSEGNCKLYSGGGDAIWGFRTGGANLVRAPVLHEHVTRVLVLCAGSSADAGRAGDAAPP